MDNVMSDKNAHYAVPGHIISKLVRMIYILADRDKQQTAKLITLAKKLVSSPLISYDNEEEETYTLNEMLKLSGTYIDNNEEE